MPVIFCQQKGTASADESIWISKLNYCHYPFPNFPLQERRLAWITLSTSQEHFYFKSSAWSTDSENEDWKVYLAVSQTYRRELKLKEDTESLGPFYWTVIFPLKCLEDPYGPVLCYCFTANRVSFYHIITAMIISVCNKQLQNFSAT